ncbi:MAG TPA: patatin-like phospholipase RssA [Pseudomonadales bacterium]|nr:patatin-like phospholipase RssA [Pseudomonadales bacterium]
MVQKGPIIGMALGSGSARGWAHIGVLKALREAGIVPHVIAGTSAGALVGAAYAAGWIDELEKWVCELDAGDVRSWFDVSLGAGGLLQGRRLISFFKQSIGAQNIEDLPMPFGAVATDMASGREIWLRSGDLMNSVRASISLPGIFTPVEYEGRWLLDGGLVNPIPVSLCRAMGADYVIAVNLNNDIVGRRVNPKPVKAPSPPRVPETQLGREFNKLVSRVSDWFGTNELDRPEKPEKIKVDKPSMLDVMSSSISIMQDRITKSRMAGDPPDVMISPRLAHFGLMEFERGREAIEEGQAAVEPVLPSIKRWLNPADTPPANANGNGGTA